VNSFRDDQSSYPDMSTYPAASGRIEKGTRTMELFIPIMILVAWIVLQAWVLPRFGVNT
jgi:hypothetical protein